MKAIEQTMTHLGNLQNNAETAPSRDSRLQVATLVLPTMNEMFDLGASRYTAVKFHISLVIFCFLIFLLPAG